MNWLNCLILEKKSRNNKYSNTDIQVYHDYFRIFYKKLRDLAPNIDSLDLAQKQFLIVSIEYFQNRINCLSNNTGANAPYEVIESIKCAAKDWVADIDDYIILPKFGDYSFFYDIIRYRGLYTNRIYLQLRRVGLRGDGCRVQLILDLGCHRQMCK